jgi:hypothetical protein
MQLPKQIADARLLIPDQSLPTGLIVTVPVVVSLVERCVQITRRRTGGNTESILRGDVADQLR